jgi:hypothetical protein
MAALTLAQRDKAAAAWEADQIRTLDPKFESRRWLDSYPMADGRQRTRLTKVFDELGV